MILLNVFLAIIHANFLEMQEVENEHDFYHKTENEKSKFKNRKKGNNLITQISQVKKFLKKKV